MTLTEVQKTLIKKLTKTNSTISISRTTDSTLEPYVWTYNGSFCIIVGIEWIKLWCPQNLKEEDIDKQLTKIKTLKAFA